MSRTLHFIYIGMLTLIVLIVLAMVIQAGFSYYQLPVEERFFYSGHDTLKPSGVIGHGYGIAGSLLMLFGVGLYMMRKRFRVLSRLGFLKHWLEFHIFLCALGPMLVLFHTAFKFGGLVAISFWSMVAVFLSGIIGRFIYIQIPRSIEGRELSLNEVQQMKLSAGEMAARLTGVDAQSASEIAGMLGEIKSGSEKRNAGFLQHFSDDRKKIRRIRALLSQHRVGSMEYRQIMRLVKSEVSLNRRIRRLNTMQDLFRYWHVAHLPFALVMLVIMIIHVIVTITFGYRWIF